MIRDISSYLKGNIVASLDGEEDGLLAPGASEDGAAVEAGIAPIANTAPKRYPFLQNPPHDSPFSMTFRSVITMANAIIGVSILAMPFCFKQCGIVLATLMILFSGFVVKISCHFMVKAALIARRRNYELLGMFISCYYVLDCVHHGSKGLTGLLVETT